MQKIKPCNGGMLPGTTEGQITTPMNSENIGKKGSPDGSTHSYAGTGVPTTKSGGGQIDGPAMKLKSKA